ncbi:MAG: hypothetical protein R6U93_04685 [Dehalococcoidia bacterium]
MRKDRILFDCADAARSPAEIRTEISGFRDDYINATWQVIQESEELDDDGAVFVACASLILKKFGMTRRGPFGKNKSMEATLRNCWDEVGGLLTNIKQSLVQSGHPRGRLLLELDESRRDKVIADIWNAMKRLLPYTMGDTAYGLVGASKILFSVFPEIVLPIDNRQWLYVFQTVDITDVIKWMAVDIRRWENLTTEKLNELDITGRLTTLPSVYNVMAMAARPRSLKS